MKKTTVMLLAVAAVSLPAAAGRETLNLVPWPKRVEPGRGFLALTPSSRIVPRQPALAPLAKVLSDELYMATAVRLSVVDGEDRAGDVVLGLEPALGEERYVLTVADRVVIRGGDYRAVAWGTATLVQAARSGHWPRARAPASKDEDRRQAEPGPPRPVD